MYPFFFFLAQHALRDRSLLTGGTGLDKNHTGYEILFPKSDGSMDFFCQLEVYVPLV